MRFVWVAAFLWVAGAGLARAQEPALAWQAPDACPTRSVWLGSLRARVDPAAWSDAAPKLRASVRIDPSAAGYVLQLDTELDGAVGQRRIEAASCAELVEASALIVALAIDPNAASRATSAAPVVAAGGAAPASTSIATSPIEPMDEPKPVEPAPQPEPRPQPQAKPETKPARAQPEPTSPAPTPPAPPDDRGRTAKRKATGPQETRLFVRPLALLDTGTLPAAAVGPALQLGLRVGPVSVELGVSYLLAQSIVDSTSDRVVAELRWIAGSVGACYTLLSGRRLELAPCLRGELGRLWGRGRNLEDETLAGGATWLAVLPGVQLGYEPIHGLVVGLELAAGLPLLPSAFTVTGLGTVHETPDLVGRLTAGITLRF